MASRIQGITVEIGGDTTKLSAALSKVNKEIRDTQSQLKDVNKLLKLDPGNAELMSQKQKLLAQAVSETKEKLDALKLAGQQANDALARGEIYQSQYDALQREIVETEKALEELEQQADKSAVALQKIGATGEKLKSVGSSIEGVGKKLMPVTAAVGGLGAAAVKIASDFDSGMSKVAAVSGATGTELDKLREKAREMGAKTKFSASEAAEAMNYMAMAGWKTGDMLDGIEGVMNLAAASGEDLATTSDIVTDALTAMGMTASEKATNAEALVGKNAMSGFLAVMNAAPGDIKKLNGAISNCDGTAEKMATTMQDNLAGQLTILKSQLEELAISVGEILMPSIRQIVGWIQGLVDWLNGLDEGTKAWNGIRSVVQTVMNTIQSVVSGVWNSVRSVTSSVLSAVRSAVSNVFNNVVSSIRDAMGNIYNTIVSGFNQAVGFITGLASSVFRWGADLINGIVNGIRSCIGNVVSAISDVANTIRSYIHFSVPDVGPLTDYESWMPDFMGGLAKGIERSKGLVRKAVGGVAADMVIRPGVSAMESAQVQTASVDSMRQMISGIQEMFAGIQNRDNVETICIPVYVGGILLDEVVVNAQARQNLRSGGR